MENDVRINLLARVARSASSPGAPVDPAKPVSILSLAAASYGARPSEDATVPTGFDPLAVALFEAIVEGAYLVANADGVFDDEERRIFERVVVAACGGTVAPQQIAALLSDLSDQLAEDGVDRRIEALSRTATKKEHAQEVLRIAALLAQASEDVSAVERTVLGKIAKQCGLEPTAVDAALDDVKKALSSPASA
ncbi:MAG TPA: tellurite resistance TerB family protein [Polyangiaceae bacterium]|jgi:tellurite resistance protein